MQGDFSSFQNRLASMPTETPPENSDERGLAKQLSDLITAKLLFSITLLISKWILPICTIWLQIISKSVCVQFNFGPAVIADCVFLDI